MSLIHFVEDMQIGVIYLFTLSRICKLAAILNKSRRMPIPSLLSAAWSCNSLSPWCRIYRHGDARWNTDIHFAVITFRLCRSFRTVGSMRYPIINMHALNRPGCRTQGINEPVLRSLQLIQTSEALQSSRSPVPLDPSGNGQLAKR